MTLEVDGAKNLTFREAARKLANLHPGSSISRTTAYDVLRKLLRSGSLDASILVGQRWLTIPRHYWADVPSKRMKQMLAKEKGEFRIFPYEIADDLASFFTGAENSFGEAELRTLLKQSQRGFEPEIQFEEWQSYLQSNELSDRPAFIQTTKKKARRQLEEWKSVAAFLVGFFIAKHNVKIGKKEGFKNHLLEVADEFKQRHPEKLDQNWPGKSSIRDMIDAGEEMADLIQRR